MKPARIDMNLDRDGMPGCDAAARTRSAPRILIVEDNYFVAHQCQSALSDAGYEVVGVVTSADDAVKEALAQRPNLVLMDIYLVGARDGIDAALEIFERTGIRSIFASALADAAGKARADAAQPLAWLAKPFSNRRLIATVTSAMEDVGASEPTQA